ncbi:MAG: hypothetical protein ACK4PR_02135 [Gammaproteobacteria bacterium]
MSLWSEYTGNCEQKKVMNPFNYLKILVLTFISGTLLLAIGCWLFMSNTAHCWLLLGIYSWSGALFIIYKTFRLLKESKQYGTFKKQ